MRFVGGAVLLGRHYVANILALTTRRVEITLLQSSFPRTSVVARRLRAAAGYRNIALDFGLICTGLLTRPPLVQGFSLGDTWAWLRYRRAFADTPDLRLREEWTGIDPHQKTILSDEVSVGLLGYFLIRRVGLTFLGDTNYVANAILPGIVQLGPPARRGPAKSPD